MKIENQVISLEQAKRLKELGIEQLSVFCYMAHGKDFTGSEVVSINNFYKAPEPDFTWVSAFTVSELQLMCGTMGNVEISEHNPTEGCFYSYYNKKFVYFKTLAAAFAAKLIRNLENEYYTAAEANERLKNR